jgi:hypothetical protein
VVYLCQDRRDEESGELVRRPVATAFCAAIQSPEGSVVPYFVTARHVIEEAAAEDAWGADGSLYIRWNRVDGGFEDAETRLGDWWLSETADVAAIRVRRQGKATEVFLQPIYPTMFIDSQYRFTDTSPNLPLTQEAVDAGQVPTVSTGDEVFLVGLFEQSPGSRVFPVARIGHVARMPVDPLTMVRHKGPPPETFQALAYLVETLSWGGSSGSPVFWSQEYTLRELADFPGGFIDMKQYMIGFLGLLSAHYDIEKKGRITGDILGTVRTDLNSGMAIVTPAHNVLELLERGDVRKEREATPPKGHD